MIAVKLLYQDKILIGIESRGHAGYAYKGKDIVCAAVSTLMQALMLGLEGREGVECLADDRVPVMRITWPETEQENISVLTDTIASSLEQIALENPRFVKIITEEI